MAVGVAGCTTDPSFESTDQFLSRNSGFIPNGQAVPNDHGSSSTISTNGQGGIDLTNEFFQNLGINGRRCISCHLPTAGWTITPDQMQATFDKTNGGLKDDDFGLGAAFRPNDGSNNPDVDPTDLDARRAAYSMLLTKGLIRVGIGIPATAEFTLTAVDDPYGHANAGDLSLFRRPLPSTNLKFLSAVMWDGRETFKDQAGQFESIHFDLSDQANGATQGHAQSPVPLTDAQREAIVNMESSLFTAQTVDNGAGNLATAGGQGGPDNLSNQDFYIGINDVFGDSHTGAAFNQNAFTIYNAWNGSSKKDRAAVARGQKIFNTKKIVITGVSGLNDEFGIPSLNGTCTTCHDAPNAGDHSVVAPLNIGLVDASQRTADMPLYTLTCNSGPHAGEVYTVTDPGRALITGKCKDIGRFKGPILRGLASRAPYFHNGSAATLEDAVNFYDNRFNIGLSAQEKSDLAAFLATL
jgi:hypothetical protein